MHSIQKEKAANYVISFIKPLFHKVSLIEIKISYSRET